MAGYYDSIDLKFSFNGDLSLDEGDIGDTGDDLLQSLKQEIHTICASYTEDWELYPNLGSGLSDYIGEPNNRRTAERIGDRLRVSITSAGIVSEDDLDIRVIPVHRHKVMIIVKVSVIPTAGNGLNTNSNAISVSLVFDFVEQGMYFLNKIPELQAQ